MVRIVSPYVYPSGVLVVYFGIRVSSCRLPSTVIVGATYSLFGSSGKTIPPVSFDIKRLFYARCQGEVRKTSKIQRLPPAKTLPWRVLSEPRALEKAVRPGIDILLVPGASQGVDVDEFRIDA